MLSEKISAEELRKLKNNQLDADLLREKLQVVLETLAQLKPYVNPDHHDLKWNDSYQHVVAGRALFNLLGDYTSPMIQGKANLECHLPPGNKFLRWSFDTIVLSKIDKNESIAGQNIFIYEATTPETLIEYAEKKGGLPVIRNANKARLNSCMQSLLEVWRETDEKVHLGSDAWSSTMNIISTHIQDAWTNDFSANKEVVENIVQILKNTFVAE